MERALKTTAEQLERAEKHLKELVDSRAKRRRQLTTGEELNLQLAAFRVNEAVTTFLQACALLDRAPRQLTVPR